MSFHGQEVHNEEHSRLVPPQISAQGLVMFALKTLPQIQSHFIRREYMFDVSIYELIKNPMFYASNSMDEPSEAENAECNEAENEPASRQGSNESQAERRPEAQHNDYDMGEDSNEEWFQSEIRSETYMGTSNVQPEDQDIDDEFWNSIVDRTRQLKRD
jgi:hypothetical protein